LVVSVICRFLGKINESPVNGQDKYNSGCYIDKYFERIKQFVGGRVAHPENRENRGRKPGTGTCEKMQIPDFKRIGA
jgi:hypothetical protein